MADTPEVRGFAEVLGRLASASLKLRRTISRKVVVAGARVIAAGAKRNAPRKTGTLRRAIFGHYSRKRSRTDVVTVALVRVRSGNREGKRRVRQGKSNRDAYYAGWVEFGHRIVGRGRASIIARRRGAGKRVPPHPFLAPAYQSEGQKALLEMERVAREGLGEAAR